MSAPSNERRPDRPVWTSASVAARRLQQQQQQQPQQAQGRQSAQTDQPTVPAGQSSGSASSRWAAPVGARDAGAAGPSRSSASSRWAVSPPPAAAIPSLQPPETRGSAPELRLPASPARLQVPRHPSPSSSPLGAGGLRPRDASKPLGGKMDRMALLASPSRGLDSDAVAAELAEQGNTDLTDRATQQEFRTYISEQIGKRFASLVDTPLLSLSSDSVLPTSTASSRQGPSIRSNEQRAAMQTKREEVEQTMLLVRKLREGCVASGQLDAFTLDVYELSVYLTLLCLNIPQLSSSLPRLVLDLYPAVAIKSSSPGLETENDALRDAERIGLNGDHARSNAVSSSSRLAGGKAHAALIRRAHFSSLLLLRTLCLSGHASRLGQYAGSSSPAAGGGEKGSGALSSTLKEYHALRLSIDSSLRAQAASVGLETLPAEAQRHLDVAANVYRIVRDANVYRLHRLLSSRDGEMTVWQRILVLQLVPVVRDVAWRTVRKAYMTVPISWDAAAMLGADEEGTTQQIHSQGGGENSGWITRTLLLDTAALSVSASEASGASNASRGGDTTAIAQTKAPPATVPDDWDADESAGQDDLAVRLAATTLSSHRSPSSVTPAAAAAAAAVESQRLYDFLVSLPPPLGLSSGDEMRQRLAQTRDGGWTLKVK